MTGAARVWMALKKRIARFHGRAQEPVQREGGTALGRIYLRARPGIYSGKWFYKKSGKTFCSSIW